MGVRSLWLESQCWLHCDGGRLTIWHAAVCGPSSGLLLSPARASDTRGGRHGRAAQCGRACCAPGRRLPRQDSCNHGRWTHRCVSALNPTGRYASMCRENYRHADFTRWCMHVLYSYKISPRAGSGRCACESAQKYVASMPLEANMVLWKLTYCSSSDPVSLLPGCTCVQSTDRACQDSL